MTAASPCLDLGAWLRVSCPFIHTQPLPAFMLSTRLKATIRNTYRQIADGLPGFVPRKEQNFLVAEIAKTLTGEYDKSRRILVAEAGTGIGKSLSYAQGAIPVARLTQKKLVISTATVALQEQLIHKDLPFITVTASCRFVSCWSGAPALLLRASAGTGGKGSEMANFELDFGALSKHKPSDADKACYQGCGRPTPKASGTGSGQLAQTHSGPLAGIASPPTATPATRPEPPSALPFHRARNDMDAADVLVVNHALLLSDLTMGAASYCRRRTSASMCWTKPITCPPSPGITAPPAPASRIPPLAGKAGAKRRQAGQDAEQGEPARPQLKLQDALASLSAGSQGPRAVARQQ